MVLGCGFSCARVWLFEDFDWLIDWFPPLRHSTLQGDGLPPLRYTRRALTLHVCMYVCKDSAAPAHARTRAHRPAAPRQSSGVSQTPHLTLYPLRYSSLQGDGRAATEAFSRVVALSQRRDFAALCQLASEQHQVSLNCFFSKIKL